MNKKYNIFFVMVMSVLCVACQHMQTDHLDIAMDQTRLGLAYLAQHDRVRAKRTLVMALMQAPHSADVNMAMGYFMEQSGEKDQAQRYYLKAISLARGRGAPLNNYGAFLCRTGHYQEAEAYFLRAVADVQYEHPAAAYENAGLCSLAASHTKKAQFYFQQALAHDPKRKVSLHELARSIYMKHDKIHA